MKWPERETDLSLEASAEVKKSGPIPPLSIHLLGVVLN
jgi:hypothetical protein